jgi:molybdopterin converting factor small subunit
VRAELFNPDRIDSLMPQVFIPASLRNLTSGETIVSVSGGTIRDVILEMEKRFPGFQERVCQDDRLRPEISVVIDSQLAVHGLRAAVASESEVHFVPTVAGG